MIGVLGKMSSPEARLRPDHPPEMHHAVAADGTPIAFDLYPSSGRTGVLIVPGFWRTRRYATLQSIATRIASEMAPCAVMDLRGHGDSGGTFEFDRFEHLDVIAVSRMLLDVASLDGLLLLGLSSGGAIAISTAALHRGMGISALLLVSPVGEFTRVIPRLNPFTFHRHLSFGEAIKKPRFRWPGDDRRCPLDDARGLTLPICLIHARNDWLVSHHHSEAIAQRAGNAALHILDVPGRYHADRLFDVAAETTWAIVREFIGRFTGQ